ncbi:MAG TPA: PAS domain S-box protein [Rhodothermales bacterium]|nr:PAS domain S-box protein [Rhodothermales bacterium]
MRALLCGKADHQQGFIEATLRQRDYDVRVVADEAAALALVQEAKPYLVVLTEVNEVWLAMTAQLRKWDGEEIVVLALAPVDDAAYLEKAMASGVDDCVPKTAPEVYLETCLELIERRVLRRTRHYQTAGELREHEARISAILDTTVDGIITIDEQGHIESFNKAAESIFGYRAEEVIGENVNILMPSPYQDEHDSYIRNYLETGHRKIIGIGREVVGQNKDGSTFPLDLAVSEVDFGHRRIFTGLVRDITERRRLEQEALRISDQERRRIGQDLHDNLGQMLTGIGLIAQNLTRAMEAKGQAEAEELAEITDLIKEADQYARTLARGLIPVDLEGRGLVDALERLALNAERLFGIRCSFEQIGSVLIHDNSVATHLYRIAQEAVSNAVKHGKAPHVRMLLASGWGRVRLRIVDDGIGFPEDLDEDRPGMGVRIMQYRARVIGATLEIARGVEKGTIITCTLRRTDEPLHRAAG